MNILDAKTISSIQEYPLHTFIPMYHTFIVYILFKQILFPRQGFIAEKLYSTSIDPLFHPFIDSVKFS